MIKSKLARAIVVDFQGKIRVAEKNKRRVIERAENLKKRYSDKEITYSDYQAKYRREINGRTLEEWAKYYNSYIAYCKNEIKKHQSKITQNKTIVVALSIIFILTLSLSVVFNGPSFVGFSVQDTDTEPEAPTEESEPSPEPEAPAEEPIIEEPTPEPEPTEEPTTEEPTEEIGGSIITSGTTETTEEEPTTTEEPITPTNDTTTTEEPTNETTPEETNQTDILSNETTIIPGTTTTEEPTTTTNQTTNETKQLNETNITTTTNVTGEAIITTIQLEAVLGQPVKWKKIAQLTTPSKVKVKLPKEAKNILVKKSGSTEDAKFTLTGKAISTRFVADADDFFLVKFFKRLRRAFTGRVVQELEQEIEIDDTESEYEIEYETPAPEALTEKTERGKRIIINSPENLHYKEVLAFTNISEELKIRNPSKIKVYWVENDTYLPLSSAKDTNNNGIYDYIEWNVPHLSTQTFDIIIAISAEHLDQNRIFISDIYQNISHLDGNWSEEIPNKHFVRVTFEKNLTPINDITIFPRIVKGNPRVEVYEVNGTKLLAEFNPVLENQYNKIFLTELNGTQDTFDLQIIGGSLEFDHIIDPTTQNGSGSGSSQQVNISINEVNLSRTFMVFQQSNPSENQPDQRQWTPKFDNASQISFQRSTVTAVTSSFNYQIVESPKLRTQQGGIAFPDQTNALNITIDEVNLTEAFVIVYGRCAATQNARNHDGFFTANLSTSTRLLIKRGATESDCDAYAEWQVIEYEGANVQKGNTTFLSGDLVKISKIDAVNLTESFLVFNLLAEGTDPGLDSNMISGNFTNSSGIAFQRFLDAGTLNDRVIVWYVVSIPKANVQKGTTEKTNTDPLVIPITEINSSSSFVLMNHHDDGTGTAYDNQESLLNITNSTALRLRKTTPTGKTTVNWQVIELPQEDVTSPEGYKIYPANNTVNDTLSVKLQVNSTDKTDLASQTFYIWNYTTGEELYTYQQNITGFSKYVNLTYNFTSDGNYTWSVLIKDQEENLNWSDNASAADKNWTIAVDSTPPKFNPFNNITTYQNQSVSYTINATDDWIGLNTFTSNDSTRFTIYSNGTFVNITSLSEEIYIVNITIDDYATNENTTLLFIDVAEIPTSDPVIENVTAVAAVDLIEAGIYNITFNFTVTDPDGVGDLDDSTAMAEVNLTGQTTRTNTTCLNTGGVSGNSANYTCSIGMHYWDGNGVWSINASIRDNSGAYASNVSEKFTVNLLTSMVMTPPTLNWSSLNAGDLDQASTNHPITINNTGNDISLSIQVTAYSLQGETTTTENIPAANFTVEDTASGCSGVALANATATNVTSAILESGNNTLQAGDDTSGQEEIYFCLKGLPAELSSQDYSTSGTVADWTIEVLFVPLAAARRKTRKKKKKDLSKDKIFKAVVLILEGIKKKENLTNLQIINLLVGRLKKQETEENGRDRLISAIDHLIEELGAEYGLDQTGIIKTLISELSIIYKIRKKTLQELDEVKRIEVPLSIFSSELGSLESITKYMRENLDMTYAEIARDLNRDQRTIWTAYNKASKKKLEMIELEEMGEQIPTSIFRDRRLTILESIVNHLRENKMKYSEIGKLLNKDQRNIWTIASRAKKKIEEENNNI